MEASANVIIFVCKWSACTVKDEKVKSFLMTHKAHRVALISIFSPQPDTSLHCQTMDTGLVHRAVCLFTSQLSLVLIVLTDEGMARLS